MPREPIVSEMITLTFSGISLLLSMVDRLLKKIRSFLFEYIASLSFSYSNI